MAELPILPLKTDALLADTSHMSAEEFGAYCRILFVMWRHGAKLTDSDDELAHIAGVSPTKWKNLQKKVRRLLTQSGGILSQKRLTDTWLQVQEIRRKRARAAMTRWRPGTDASALHMDMQTASKWNANQIRKKERASSSEPMAAREEESGQPRKQESGPKRQVSAELEAVMQRKLTRSPYGA
jgi:uncharacterized protein YdaU (DUF1376 family)